MHPLWSMCHGPHQATSRSVHPFCMTRGLNSTTRTRPYRTRPDKVRARCRLRAKFHYTDPTGPARTFFAAKLRWVRAGRRQSLCGSGRVRVMEFSFKPINRLTQTHRQTTPRISEPDRKLTFLIVENLVWLIAKILKFLFLFGMPERAININIKTTSI